MSREEFDRRFRIAVEDLVDLPPVPVSEEPEDPNYRYLFEQTRGNLFKLAHRVLSTVGETSPTVERTRAGREELDRILAPREQLVIYSRNDPVIMPGFRFTEVVRAADKAADGAALGGQDAGGPPSGRRFSNPDGGRQEGAGEGTSKYITNIRPNVWELRGGGHCGSMYHYPDLPKLIDSWVRETVGLGGSKSAKVPRSKL